MSRPRKEVDDEKSDSNCWSWFFLSGLWAASLLAAQGIKCRVLEA